MRLAKQTQCPKCQEIYAMQDIAFLGDRAIRGCGFCGWIAKGDKQRLDWELSKGDRQRLDQWLTSFGKKEAL